MYEREDFLRHLFILAMILSAAASGLFAFVILFKLLG